MQYLLIRPYPALRILFASPSQRVPGILQSPFLSKIGGSNRVREELTAAFAEGRGVTAKVRWISKSDEDGRNKWIHCTPLLGGNGQVGVWMVVIVDDDKSTVRDGRRWRDAPPVEGFVSNSSSAEGRRTNGYGGGAVKRTAAAESVNGMNGVAHRVQANGVGKENAENLNGSF